MPYTEQTSAKLPQLPAGFLAVSEAAKSLNKSVDTVTRWCQTGKLPAIPRRYGLKVTYLVPSASVQLMQREDEAVPHTSAKSIEPHSSYVDTWIQAMERGLMTGKPFSPLTVQDYETFVRSFLRSQPVVSSGALGAELLKIPAVHYSKRFKLYKGVVCFSKFLIRERALDKVFLEEVKPLYPKRHLPPKRLGVDETQLGQLMSAAKTPLLRMMVIVLAGTGLRVSEAAALRRSDIDLGRRTLTVRLGKGNKTRRLGLVPVVMEAITAHMETVRSQWLFCDEAGEPISRTSIYHRLRRLGKRAGVSVSPHAMRRAFVTLNANKGRPLQMLQIACGHSDIKTTLGYCLTTEQEVIEAMRGWD